MGSHFATCYVDIKVIFYYEKKEREKNIEFQGCICSIYRSRPVYWQRLDRRPCTGPDESDSIVPERDMCGQVTDIAQRLRERLPTGSTSTTVSVTSSSSSLMNASLAACAERKISDNLPHEVIRRLLRSRLTNNWVESSRTSSGRVQRGHCGSDCRRRTS